MLAAAAVVNARRAPRLDVAARINHHWLRAFPRRGPMARPAGESMDLQLKGKVAVVTGGTRGIGRAIAEGFADEGGHVAVCARNAEQVAAAVARLERKGRQGVRPGGRHWPSGPALRGIREGGRGRSLGGI